MLAIKTFARQFNFKVGDFREITKTFTKEDVELFGKISQDYNPIHFDENYAKTTKFQRCICHGHLVTSLFSGLLGSHLPGKGSIYLNQTFEYVAPVFVGDTVTARVEVLELRSSKSKGIVTMETTIKKLDQFCVKGVAKVMVPLKDKNLT